MHKTIIRTASVLALACLPFSASALSITVTETTTALSDAQDDFRTQLGKLQSFVIEDFESFSLDQNGQKNFDLSNRTLSTRVGDMVFSGSSGGGSAVRGDAGSGRINSATDESPFFGRFNTSSSDFGGNSADGEHNQYLETNDVQTMTWNAFDRDDVNNTFDRLLFSITDFADQGATFRVMASEDKNTSATFTLSSGALSGEIRNFVVAFSQPVSFASVEFSNIAGPRNRDGGGFDNMTIGTVPLPAALWLLLGASGALIVAKRRSATKAA